MKLQTQDAVESNEKFEKFSLAYPVTCHSPSMHVHQFCTAVPIPLEVAAKCPKHPYTSYLQIDPRSTESLLKKHVWLGIPAS